MDETDSENGKKLSEIFEEGFHLYEEIMNTDQPTNSGEVQVKIRRAMKLFEDATRLVSITSLFSSNESIEEVATNNLKYFLLPSLLGNLTQKLCVTERIEVVNMADIYFRDFLQRCKDYRITNIDIPPTSDVQDEDQSTSSQVSRALTPAQALMNSAHSRANKIQLYNEQKALQRELKTMKEQLDLTTYIDDELKRKYYITLINCHINEGIKELESLQSEKEILKYMSKVKAGGSLKANEIEEKVSKGPKPKPLKAVIITKDEFQKKVFGAGYPSLPTMTVKEFYDQRVKDGVFPDAATVKARSLLDMANQQNAEALAEQEEAEKEHKIETDDEETLARARAMDEYKDTHQRGWGNRYNRS